MILDSRLAVGVVDLVDRRVVELSRLAREQLGLGDADPSTLRIDDLLEDAEASGDVLDLVAEGKLEGYEVRRHVRGPGGYETEARVVVQALGPPSERRFAVALLAPPASSRAGGLEPDDEERLRDAFLRAVESDESTEAVVHVRDPRGEQRRVLVTLQACTGDGTAGSVADEIRPHEPPAQSERVGQLERHLWRIAQEIEAAGVIPTLVKAPEPTSVPGLEDLTTRQWEIVTRLLRGERVPTIARSMFLSTSTVRNHLSTIYRKVGVHSQAELLEKLARP